MTGIVTEGAPGVMFTVTLTSEPVAPVAVGLPFNLPDAVDHRADDGYAGCLQLAGRRDLHRDAIDDSVSHVMRPGLIIASPPVTADPIYAVLNVPYPVMILLFDDDVPAIAFTRTAFRVGENGTTDEVGVRLKTIPSEAVTVTFLVAGPGLQPPLTSLTFQPDVTAMQPQTVTVSAMQNIAVEGDVATALLAVATGREYSGVNALLAGTAADDDVAYVVAADAISVGEGSGTDTPIAFRVMRSGGYTDTASTVDFAVGGTAGPADLVGPSPTGPRLNFTTGVHRGHRVTRRGRRLRRRERRDHHRHPVESLWGRTGVHCRPEAQTLVLDDDRPA